MSGAERTRRYREKFRHDEPVTKSVDPVQAKAARIAQLENTVVARAVENAALRDELAQAKSRIAELEMRGEQPEAGADVIRLEAEIAALRNENHAFRVELEAQNDVIKTRNGGGLTKGQYAILQKCCHPDNSASPETRAKGIRLLDQLRYVLCNEAELPSMDPSKFHITFRRLWARRKKGIKEAKKYAKRQRPKNNQSQPKASSRPPRDLPKA
jgi:hypothetical protein